VPEAERTSPQMRPSASRMHLRPQPSYRALYVRRDSYQQVAPSASQQAPVATTRTSPGSSAGTMSEDERSRRANELVQSMMQDVQRRMQDRQRTTLAQAARVNATAVQQRIDQRLAENMGRGGVLSSGIGETRPVGQVGVANGTNPQPATLAANRASNSPAAGGLSDPSYAAQAQAAVPTRAPLQRHASNQQATNFTGQNPPVGLNLAPGNSHIAPPPVTTFPSSGTPPGQNRAAHAPQPPQRTHVEQTPTRDHAPVMAQGVTAITTGGDCRRN
jgi:hypothetical protein